MLYAPNLYTFLYFEKSHLKSKKYNAVLQNKKTLREIRIPFGATGYQQYCDKTGLEIYSNLDHLDLKRRVLYKKRHIHDTNKKYSASWFALKYLW